MSGINILHLSDLHISNKRLSATSKKLIQDIVTQTNDMDAILLVVSGDIVDRGEYGKYEEGVILFFKELKEKIGKKIKGTCFVPGNHDKVRNISNRLYGQLSQRENLEITEAIWKLQEQNYQSYLQMVTKLKKIFKPRSGKVTETFGVETFEIGDNVICFIQIDTSWGTYGGPEEEGKLVIGKYQLDSLIKQYENMKGKLEENGKQISITVGVGHHPINWLHPDQEKMIKKYMIDEEYFNMNLYLCGHIHDMDLENWYNNEHSLMTLVTGIGWNHHVENKKDHDKKDEHRYSIYVIDIQKNSCDIIMRRSQKNGKFISDYSVYVNDERRMDKLCYPLKIENGNQPFINMNSPSGDFVQSIFVDVNLMKDMKKIHNSMVAFQKKSVELLLFYERNFVENQADIYEDGKEYQKTVTLLNNRFFKGDYIDEAALHIINQNVIVTYQTFTAFLLDVLANFVKIFEECFPSDSNLRVHFRWYKKETDEYQKLCQYSNVDLEKGPSISIIEWGGLIKQSYLLNDSVIYSINSKYNNHEPVRWDDFMTIVPPFFKCEQEFRNSKNEKIKRPIMTFGVSVLNSECDKEEISKILYVFEYLDLCRLITNILDDFIRNFDVDYTQYLSYIDNKISNKGE